MWSFSQLLIVVVLALSQQNKAARRAPAFTATEYPSERFQVTQGKHSHGEVEIAVIQAKKNKSDDKEPSYCRAWVEVRKEGQLLKRFYYGDIEPVGWKYGLFIPRQQPLEDFFVVLKEGDYDGRLLLIAKDGAVADLPGGPYFITGNKRFLVTEYSSDEPGLVVFDLAKRRIMAKFEVYALTDSWYHDDKGYFFMEDEKPNQIDRLDLRQGRLVAEQVSGVIRGKARKIKFDFDPSEKVDCVSQPQ